MKWQTEMNIHPPRTPHHFTTKEWKVVCLRETALPDALRDCDCPEKCCEYWHDVIENDPRHNDCVESMYVLHLNTRRRVTGHHLVAQGILDTVLAHQREVFRTAIVANAGAIVMMHNHPSGDPTPSEADCKVTREMIRAGNILRIELIDHVIIGRPDPERIKAFSSLRTLGYFYE
jgi:DNA repair protein RadC